MAKTMKRRNVARESHIPSPSELLRIMAEDMVRLSNELTDLGGRDLTDPERELIRLAHLPVLNEIFADMKMQYLSTGYIDKYELEQLVGSV